MTATEATPAPKLWTREGFREDRWRRPAADEAAVGARGVILPLDVFCSLDPDALGDALPELGVELLPGEAVEPLLPYIDRLCLVALAFPAFNDGRSYSKAHLLRGRHGYRGELRATGDILIDQLPHMLRCGFTSFEVRNPATLARLEEGRVGGIPHHYQPAVASAARGAYAWRRTA